MAYQHDLEKVLEGTVVVAGEGSIDPSNDTPVFIGMAWDDSGFTPASAIYVDWVGSEDEALQAAFEILEQHEREANPEYLEDLFEEWGERADEIFTEGWNGAAWTMSSKEAAEIILKSKWASKYIDIEREELVPEASKKEAQIKRTGMIFTIPTEEVIKRLIGSIKGFDQIGVFYEHEDFPGSIDGMHVLERILEQLPTVESFDIDDLETNVDINLLEAMDYMIATGYRASDYTEEDAAIDIEEDPLSYLGSVKMQYGIKVDPYIYVQETEEFDFEDIEDEERYLESNKKEAALSEEDKDFLYHHLRAYIAHSVPDDLQDAFEIYAIKEIEEDPEYWATRGDWSRMYTNFLDALHLE